MSTSSKKYNPNSSGVLKHIRKKVQKYKVSYNGWFINQTTGDPNQVHTCNSGLIATTPLVIIIKTTGELLEINECTMEFFNFKKDNVIGKNISKLFELSPSSIGKQKRFFTKIKNPDSLEITEWDIKCRDGYFKKVQWSFSEVVNKSDPKSIIGIGTIINPLIKENKDVLVKHRRSHKLKQKLSANLIELIQNINYKSYQKLGFNY